MPPQRESTTWTGTGTCSAAAWADSQVFDSRPEMWIDTIACAPRAMASRYAQ